MPYRPTEMTRDARERRSATLLAEARSIVEADGFRAASIKAVAAAAGVSAGTVYTYFANREELLAAVFREAADVELAAVRLAVDSVRPGDNDRALAAAQLSALVEAFARRAIRGRRLAWALLAEPVDPLIEAERLSYRRAYSDLVSDIVTRGVASGELPPQEAHIAGPGIVGAIGEALTGPLSPLNADSAKSASFTDHVIDTIRTLCLRAVGAADVQASGIRKSYFEKGDAS
jgi:AcrR family transcriptional regulator